MHPINQIIFFFFYKFEYTKYILVLYWQSEDLIIQERENPRFQQTHRNRSIKKMNKKMQSGAFEVACRRWLALANPFNAGHKY